MTNQDLNNPEAWLKEDATGNNQPCKARPNKLDTIRRLLCEGMSLNRFEAERYGDHCLNSTIAELRSRHSLDIVSDWEEVPNNFGRVTRVKRYRLAASPGACVQGVAG